MVLLCWLNSYNADLDEIGSKLIKNEKKKLAEDIPNFLKAAILINKSFEYMQKSSFSEELAKKENLKPCNSCYSLDSISEIKAQRQTVRSSALRKLREMRFLCILRFPIALQSCLLKLYPN